MINIKSCKLNMERNIVKPKNLPGFMELLPDEQILFNEMKEKIRKCKFVVVPSIWYENCPYSVMETLAIGKPVIGANIAGIPELVKHNRSGFIYNYNSSDELSERMKTLFENDNLVKKFGNNAKTDATKLYGKEKYYDNILKIYNNLLKGDK